jgi:Zn-dependent peptidase ImmA (M78 family)
MTARVRALVEPSLLVWARESAGLSPEEAAGKVQVKTERLRGWEQGEGSPTINQLRELGRIYRRPTAVFYLPEPPKDFMALRDYRRIPGVQRNEESPELRWEIRLAGYRREVALELAEEWEEEVPLFAVSASITEDIERVAERARGLLGVSMSRQASWETPATALNSWRFALEDAGVLVFQAAEVGVDEMRGFSLSERPLPVITVNNKDSYNGRIFSLMHELVHLMLDDSGLCIFSEFEPKTTSHQNIELFCNQVAAAILVPAEDLLARPSVRRKGTDAIWPPGDLWDLSGRYKVSSEVMLRRLYRLDRVDDDFYWATIRMSPRVRKEKKRGSPGWQPPPQKAVYNSGQLFSELVLDSFHEDRITAADVSDYFESRLKHLPAIEELVRERARTYRQGE